MVCPGTEKLGIFVRANTIDSEQMITIAKTLISKSDNTGVKTIERSFNVKETKEESIYSRLSFYSINYSIHTLRIVPYISQLPWRNMLSNQLNRPLGRRLHRNYCGGVKVPKDTDHMEFGLYVVFNLCGHSPFVHNI
jgi:hypothetical protein